MSTMLPGRNRSDVPPAVQAATRAEQSDAARAEALAFYGPRPAPAAPVVLPEFTAKTRKPKRAQRTSRRRPAAVLGSEIDHLRLYGMSNRDVAARLCCSVDAVEKWVKTHPEPRESWDVA